MFQGQSSLRYPKRLALAVWALALVPGAMSGCGRQPTADVGVEPAEAVPRDVIFHAHVLYGGDSAYLIDGKWYCPGTSSWLVFTKEPLELEMIRHALEGQDQARGGSGVRFGM